MSLVTPRNNYIYLIVQVADEYTLGEIVNWCIENNYNLARDKNGKVLGGWSVSYHDGHHSSPGIHRVSIGFNEISNEERMMLELRWTGQ